MNLNDLLWLNSSLDTQSLLILKVLPYYGDDSVELCAWENCVMTL